MFDAEMNQVHELCNAKFFSGAYRLVHENLASIKWGMYGTVVMLNLNCVMAAYGTYSDDGYDTLLAAPKDNGFYLSLLISLALALLNLAGYAVIMAFSTMTEVRFQLSHYFFPLFSLLLSFHKSCHYESTR
jgi:hypothetical protein